MHDPCDLRQLSHGEGGNKAGEIGETGLSRLYLRSLRVTATDSRRGVIVRRVIWACDCATLNQVFRCTGTNRMMYLVHSSVVL